MHSTAAQFRRLEAEKIIETVRMLHSRIEERFPGSGLGKVVAELQQVAEETVARTRWIQQPHLLLRFVAVSLSVGIMRFTISNQTPDAASRFRVSSTGLNCPEHVS